MRVLIFGCTGPCGIALTRKVLQVYPSSAIVLYARSPHKIPEDLASHPSVSIIPGELSELDKVEAALSETTTDGTKQQPVDLVLSALGPTGPLHSAAHPIAKFYEALTDLMHKHAVKRLIVLCTASYPDPQDKFSLMTYAIVTTVKVLAHTAYAEFRAVGEGVRASAERNGLEWTLVRVPLLTNGESEEVVAGYVGDGKVGNCLPRKAFAAFCVGEIEKREWVGKAPFISGI